MGIAAVELGKVMGARVIAAASTDEKLKVAKQYGADELVNYGDGELKEKVKELTGGKGADVIYDPVGGDLFNQCKLAASIGKAVFWSSGMFASGTIPKYPINLALLKGLPAGRSLLGLLPQTGTAGFTNKTIEICSSCSAKARSNR